MLGVKRRALVGLWLGVVLVGLGWSWPGSASADPRPRSPSKPEAIVVDARIRGEGRPRDAETPEAERPASHTTTHEDATDTRVAEAGLRAIADRELGGI
jgi:hypothetical protein